MRSPTQTLLQMGNVSVPLALVKIVGGVEEAFFLAYLMRQSVHADAHGWFWQLGETLTRDLLLSEYKQRKIRERLVGLGVVKAERRRIIGDTGQSPRWHYKIAWEVIEGLLRAIETQDPTEGQKTPQSAAGEALGDAVIDPDEAVRAVEAVAVRRPKPAALPERRMTRKDMDALLVAGQDARIAALPDYPDDVRVVVAEFANLWQVDLPQKPRKGGGAYADWIKSARELLSLNNGDEQAVLAWMRRKADEYAAAYRKAGRAPYVCTRPGALVKAMQADVAAAKMAAAEAENEKKGYRVL